MKTLIKIEDWAMFGFGFYLFTFLPYSWWWLMVFLLAPDIGMLGYILRNKVGAVSDYIFEHKGLAIVIYIFGVYFSSFVRMSRNNFIFTLSLGQSFRLWLKV